MKKGFLMIAISLMSMPSAWAAGPLDGTWEMTDRVCQPSGQPPQDAFVPGRDYVELVISNNDIVSNQRTNGQFRTVFGELQNTPQGTYMSMTMEDGTVETLKVSVGANELVLTHGNFGPGGSCKIGEDIRITFGRVK